MLDRAQRLAAGLFDGVFRVGLQGMADRIVGRQAVPLLDAGLRQCAAGAVGQRVGVVGPLGGRGRAGFARQVRGAGGRGQERDVGRARDFLHGQRDRGGRHVDDGLHVVLVDPAARGGGPDVGLVLVIAGDDFDLAAQHGGPEVLDGHAGGFDGALAREVGVHAGQVGQDADADGLVGLRMRGRQREGAGDEQGAKQWFHVFPPGWVPALRRV
ncbi:hypothetical protein G6F57_014781 [Rhizopus arrhizus]|nr:hypothetical protein G6F57_014781 [Rhizopus arrhizus]